MCKRVYVLVVEKGVSVCCMKTEMLLALFLSKIKVPFPNGRQSLFTIDLRQSKPLEYLWLPSDKLVYGGFMST